MKKVSNTFFARRPKCGEHQLYPLTAGRIIVLEEHGNPLASEEDGDAEADPFSIYEAFMVAAADAELFAELSLLNGRDWQLEVRKFSADCMDEDLNEFIALIKSEMAAIKAAQVQPVKKKRARRARTSRGS